MNEQNSVKAKHTVEGTCRRAVAPGMWAWAMLGSSRAKIGNISRPRRASTSQHLIQVD